MIAMNINDYRNILVETIFSLTEAVEARDGYTLNHSRKVTKISLEIAVRMGLKPKMLEQIKVGGLLHDIGTVGISDLILRKTSALSKIEFAKIKKHPEIGSKIVTPIEKFCKIKDIILHHHEQYDGQGYPGGLEKEQIPIGARILAVANFYDAITSSRYYRKAVSHKRAVKEIIKESGTKFDPKVVEAFLKIEENIKTDKLVNIF